MRKRAVSQEEPIRALSRAVQAGRTQGPGGPSAASSSWGHGRRQDPLGEDVGQFLFGSEEALIKLDMSEFMERHNVNRLVETPPGYVGYGGRPVDRGCAAAHTA